MLTLLVCLSVVHAHSPRHHNTTPLVVLALLLTTGLVIPLPAQLGADASPAGLRWAVTVRAAWKSESTVKTLVAKVNEFHL